MKALILALILLVPLFFMAQTTENPFYSHYESYRQPGLEKRRFTQKDILPMIQALKEAPGISVSREGESVQGRDLFLIKLGQGKTSVLLWSQMHGDEPTATMALMDVLNFFKEPKQLDSIRQLLLNELTIYIIPMLNPDGAELYQRRNALGIDLNRDALRLQSPESRFLKSVRDRIKADWGFNLHDQNVLYSAGKSSKPATISFLAPPFDEEGTVNEGRKSAMKLIGELNETLRQYIPNQIGKWPDEFEPRAFGDNMQKWGTRTVLIESGGYKEDPEKQYIRKLNFVAIMQGLLSIATNSYAGQEIGQYEEIPENERYLFNLIIRRALVEVDGKEYLMDLGINHTELAGKESQNFYYKSHIEDLGDLSPFYGYEEIDADGMQLEVGKVYPEVFDNIQALQKEDIFQLLQSGYTAVRVRTLPEQNDIHFPMNILSVEADKSYSIAQDAQPNFVLRKDGKLSYAIVNGFVVDLRTGKNGVKNALVEGE